MFIFVCVNRPQKSLPPGCQSLTLYRRGSFPHQSPAAPAAIPPIKRVATGPDSRSGSRLPRRSWICLGCLFSEGQKVGTAQRSQWSPALPCAWSTLPDAAQRSQWSPAPQRAFLRFFGSLLAKFLSEGYFQQHYWHLRMMPYPSPFQEKP